MSVKNSRWARITFCNVYDTCTHLPFHYSWLSKTPYNPPDKRRNFICQWRKKKSHKSREHKNLYFPHRLLKVIIISFDLMTIFIQSFIGAETSRAVQMNEVTKRKRKKKWKKKNEMTLNCDRARCSGNKKRLNGEKMFFKKYISISISKDMKCDRNVQTLT